MPAKACSVPGCRERVTQGRCPVHARPTLAPAPRYDSKPGDPHNTARWQATRRAYLAEHPLCESGEHRGIAPRAELVHHRQAVKDGGDLCDAANLQALCWRCHEVIEARRGTRQGPRSGKSQHGRSTPASKPSLGRSRKCQSGMIQ